MVMSPMEFRLVTARDLRAGWRHPTGPEGPPAAVAPLEYALNPDRAWTPSPERIRMEVLRLTTTLLALRARPAEVRLTDSTSAEQFAMGVLAAVRWTLGNTRQRPLDLAPAPVCDAEVDGQLRKAMAVVRTDGDGWAQAAGVAGWLQWLIGATGKVTYPDGWGGDPAARDS